MNLELAIAGFIFSLGGAWFFVNRSKEDIDKLWGQLDKWRKWAEDHEKEANDRRFELLTQLSEIEKETVTKEEMRRDFERLYEKLDRLNEKFDRQFENKNKA